MDRAKQTILIVDDDQALLKLFSTALALQGYRVLEAQNGHEGLAVLNQAPVDLIIADWKMPGMNGVSMLRNIRSMDGWKDLPVMVVSASEDSDAMAAACELGVRTWLKKPFRFKLLIRTIRENLPHT